MRMPFCGALGDEVSGSSVGRDPSSPVAPQDDGGKSGQHIPVLLAEVIAHLALRPGDAAVDCTYGGGGYTAAMLRETAPDGRVLAIDLDPHVAAASVSERVMLVHGSFGEIAALASRSGFRGVRAIVADLGLSSLQLADPARGFSFQGEGPLDMRFDPTSGAPSAADLLADLPQHELERIIRMYGEERNARAIAAAVVAQRGRTRIRTTAQLAAFVAAVLPRRGSRIHPATRTFQALRIAVNDELGTLERAIPQMLEVVAPGGRVAIVSFHSLEDRIVKRSFRNAAAAHEGSVVTAKPIVPTEGETAGNPRSRSAKLRVFERSHT